jgi:hypothetical protein
MIPEIQGEINENLSIVYRCLWLTEERVFHNLADVLSVAGTLYSVTI